MRRAQQRSKAAFRRQSAAGVTSLAPHDSKARLRVVTTCRRFMAKPCTPHLITRKGYATSVRQQSCQRLCNAQRVQLFELLSCNGGVKGQSPLHSLGGPRGPFSHVREWPPWTPKRMQGALPLDPAIAREQLEELHALRIAQPLAALLPYGCGIPLAGNQVRCTWLRHESSASRNYSQPRLTIVRRE